MTGERRGCSTSIHQNSLNSCENSNREEKILLNLYILVLATVRLPFSITERSSKMRCTGLRQTHRIQVVLK